MFVLDAAAVHVPVEIGLVLVAVCNVSPVKLSLVVGNTIMIININNSSLL
jgi:hypothetical protein